jgi:hypothetical protein
MASTYSQYKIELVGTGEQAGTWGTTTNNNFGSATPGTYQGFEQAIGGKADVTMSSTTITLSLTNANTAQDARALYLNLTGSPGGAADLVVPAIQKGYLVKNGADAVVTVKVSGQTGVAVPVGKTMWLYNNGTDVTNAIDNLPSGATVGGVAIGTGTGDVVGPASATDAAIVAFDGTTGKLIKAAVLGTGVQTALGINTGSAGAFVVNGGALGTPSSGTLTNATGLPISTGVSGLGTNVASFLATPSSSNLAAAVTDETGSGFLVFATSPTLVTPVLGTPTSGNLSNCTVDGTNEVGFRNVPAVGTKTTAYVLAVGDVGKYVRIDTGGSIEIPNSTFSEGDAVSLFNDTTGDITVTCTITTAYIAGADADVATVTLATRGICTIFFISGTVCVITGNIS